MRITHAAAALGLLALGACTGIDGATLSPRPDAMVDSSYRHSGQRWTSGGEYHHYYRPIEEDGKITVCGATVIKPSRNSFSDALVADILGRTRVELNGKTLFRNVDRHFRVTRTTGEVDRPETAQCTATGLPWIGDALVTMEVKGPTSVNLRN